MRNKFHKNIKKFILNDTKSATTRQGGGIFLINPSVKPIGLPAPFTREPYKKGSDFSEPFSFLLC